MKPILRRFAPACLALVFAAACDREEPGAPLLSEPATVAIALEFSGGGSASAGLLEAFLKTNRLWLQFRDANSARDERQVAFSPTTQQSQVPLLIRLRRPVESLQFNIEVRLGAAGVFRGTAPVTLRAGRLTTVTASLSPILAGVRAPDSVPILTAWGDTVSLNAAGILATGDTIQGVSVLWTSLDPVVATIDEGGKVVSRTDGTARMVAVSGAFADTALVRILAGVQTVVISPPRASIPLGGTQQFTITLYDRRGNVLPPRPVTWSSSQPNLVAITPTGVARGVGIGTSEIRATVGSSVSAAEATILPIPPTADSLEAIVIGLSTANLKARVIPNGAATHAWFEWGSKQISTPPFVIQPLPVGAGLLAVPVATTLTGLRPNTLYYAVTHASNSAGAAMSDTVWFTTGNPNSGSNPPKAYTDGWSLIQPGWVLLIGSVETDGVPTDGWFEWSTSSTLAGAQKTPVQTVNGTGRITVTAAVQLPATAGTWYFRFVAQNGNGTSNGAILGLTLFTPGSPSASTEPATSVTSFAATLHGTANPNGFPATAWFEWGTSPTLAGATSTPAQALGSGFANIGFSFGLIALAPNTTYYFRLHVSNSAGSASGPILAFTTLPDPAVTPPTVTTDAAVKAFEMPVQLNGTVNPNGGDATAWFEWSSSPTLATFTATPWQQLGAGTTPVAFNALLTGFPVNLTGFYRAVARNAGGTTYGAIIAF